MYPTQLIAVNVLGRACLVRLPKSIVSFAEHRAKQHNSKDIPCSSKSRNFFKRSSEDQYLSTVTSTRKLTPPRLRTKTLEIRNAIRTSEAFC